MKRYMILVLYLFTFKLQSKEIVPDIGSSTCFNLFTFITNKKSRTVGIDDQFYKNILQDDHLKLFLNDMMDEMLEYRSLKRRFDQDTTLQRTSFLHFIYEEFLNRLFFRWIKNHHDLELPLNTGKVNTLLTKTIITENRPLYLYFYSPKTYEIIINYAIGYLMAFKKGYINFNRLRGQYGTKIDQFHLQMKQLFQIAHHFLFIANNKLSSIYKKRSKYSDGLEFVEKSPLLNAPNSHFLSVNRNPLITTNRDISLDPFHRDIFKSHLPEDILFHVRLMVKSSLYKLDIEKYFGITLPEIEGQSLLEIGRLFKTRDFNDLKAYQYFLKEVGHYVENLTGKKNSILYAECDEKTLKIYQRTLNAKILYTPENLKEMGAKEYEGTYIITITSEDLIKMDQSSKAR